MPGCSKGGISLTLEGAFGPFPVPTEIQESRKVAFQICGMSQARRLTDFRVPKLLALQRSPALSNLPFSCAGSQNPLFRARGGGIESVADLAGKLDLAHTHTHTRSICPQKTFWTNSDKRSWAYYELAHDKESPTWGGILVICQHIHACSSFQKTRKTLPIQDADFPPTANEKK